MDYGLKVKNKYGEGQIDGSNQNYSYVQRGDSLTGTGTQPTSYSITFTKATPHPPLVLLRPYGNSGIYLKGFTYSNGLYTGATIIGTVSFTFDYRVYFLSPELSADAYGLHIRNEQGKLVFDSGRAPFKIHSIHTVSIGSGNSHATISKPFYLMSPWLSGLILSGHAPVFGPVLRMASCFYDSSATAFTTGWVAVAVVGSSATSDSVTQSGNMTVIVCDVGPTLSG